MATYEKLLVGRDVKDIILNITSEDGELIEIPLKLRGLPWSLKNQKISLSVKWSDEGQTSFDGFLYKRVFEVDDCRGSLGRNYRYISWTMWP